MRVIANNVEFFDLMRDQGTLTDSPDNSLPESPSDDSPFVNAAYVDRGLRDSLWYFDGNEVKCWMDVEDLLVSASSENERELPQPISITTDFYPSSVVLNRGILVGLDADLVQRRDFPFAFFRHTIRACLSCSLWYVLADVRRLNSFCHKSFAVICLISIRRQPPASLFATKDFHIFLMPSRCFSTMSWMTK